VTTYVYVVTETVNRDWETDAEDTYVVAVYATEQTAKQHVAKSGGDLSRQELRTKVSR
jgi:hypothetical protein